MPQNISRHCMLLWAPHLNMAPIGPLIQIFTAKDSILLVLWPILRLHVCYSGSNWCFTVTDIQGAWVALTILTQIFFQTKLSFSKILYIPITLKTVLYLHQIFSSLPSVLPSWPVPTASQYYQNFPALFEQHKTHSPTSWYNPPSVPKLSLSLLLLIRNSFPTIHVQRIYT